MKRWFGYDPETHKSYFFGAVIAEPHPTTCLCRECLLIRIALLKIEKLTTKTP